MLALEHARTGVCIYDGAHVHVYPYSEPCPAVHLAPLCDGKRDGAAWTETPDDVLDSYALYDGDGICVHRPR